MVAPTSHAVIQYQKGVMHHFATLPFIIPSRMVLPPSFMREVPRAKRRGGGSPNLPYASPSPMSRFFSSSTIFLIQSCSLGFRDSSPTADWSAKLSNCSCFTFRI